MNDHIKVYSGSAITVNRLASLLEENDIPSMIRDNPESGRVAGFGVPENSVELFVNTSDQERAHQIIEEYEKEINR